MKNVYGIMFLILILTCTGCTSGEQGKINPATEAGKPDTRTGESAYVAIEFYLPQDGPDMTNMKTLAYWFSIWVNHVSFVSDYLVAYKRVNGTFPASLDDLMNGYALFLPANPETKEPYRFEAKGAGPYEAGTIVVEIDPAGWSLYGAKPLSDGGFEVITVDGEKLMEMVAGSTLLADEPEITVFNSTFNLWLNKAIQGFINRHARMPESYEELTEGFIRNPSTTLGYTPGDNGAGNFRIGVNPAEWQWAYASVRDDGAEAIAVHEYIVNEFGQIQAMEPVQTQNVDTGEFKWILTSDEFMN